MAQHRLSPSTGGVAFYLSVVYNFRMEINITKTPVPHFQLTKDSIIVISDAMRNGVSFKDAALLTGLKPRTIANIERDIILLNDGDEKVKEFSAAYMEILETLLAELPQAHAEYLKNLETVVNDAALGKGKFAELGPDAKLALDILSRRDPGRWGKTNTVIQKQKRKDDERKNLRLVSTEELEAALDGEVREVS